MLTLRCPWLPRFLPPGRGNQPPSVIFLLSTSTIVMHHAYVWGPSPQLDPLRVSLGGSATCSLHRGRPSGHDKAGPPWTQAWDACSEPSPSRPCRGSCSHYHLSTPWSPG